VGDGDDGVQHVVHMVQSQPLPTPSEARQLLETHRVKIASWLQEQRARGHGEHVGRYAERLLDRPLPWTTTHQGYQLLRLCETHGSAKVDAVCERSLSFGVLDVPRIARTNWL
jgi:hypothetical protein